MKVRLSEALSAPVRLRSGHLFTWLQQEGGVQHERSVQCCHEIVCQVPANTIASLFLPKIESASSAEEAKLKSLPIIRKSVNIDEIVRCVYERIASSWLMFAQPRAPPVESTVG